MPAAVAQLTPGTYDPGHILVGDNSGQMHQVALAPGVSVAEAIASYQNAVGVAYAEPDYLVHAAVTPDDAFYSLEWGLNNTGQTVNGATGTADADIDAPQAWDITTGSTATVVADIDTGIDYTHPDLYLNIWINQDEIPTSIRNNLTDTDGDGLITFYDLNNSVNQGTGKITDLNGNGRIDGGDLLNNSSGWENGVDNDGDGKIDDLIGWDFVNNDNDPVDDNGHGSHTAGTIGAIGDNGVGVTGVNWRVQIAAFKFLNSSGSGSISNAQASLDLAVANGIKISNNSWGGGGFSQSFLNSLNAANAAWHIFVAAAGNSSSNNNVTPSYPASYNAPNVISVAATDSRDQLGETFQTTAHRAWTSRRPASTSPAPIPMANTSTSAAPRWRRRMSPAWSRCFGHRIRASPFRTQSRVSWTANIVSGLTTKVAGGRRLNAFNALNTGGGGGDTAGPRTSPPTCPMARPP